MNHILKRMLTGVSVCMTLIVLLFVGTTLIGCGTEDSESSKKIGTTDETSKDDNAETSENVNKQYHPGDVISMGDFEISYSSAKEYKSKNEFIQPDKGNKYVKFDFTFKNSGDADAMVGSFECYYANKKCEQEYLSEDGSNFLVENLSSGREVSGSVFFEVPDKAKLKDVELEYENYDIWSDTKIVFKGK